MVRGPRSFALWDKQSLACLHSPPPPLFILYSIPFHLSFFSIYSDFKPPAMAMSSANPTTSFLFFCLLLFTLLIPALCRPTGFGGSFPLRKDVTVASSTEMARSGITRGELIGSTAPICTYNECRGCRFKCSAEQVPVDAGDPMNSAYRYRCVCHR